MASRLDDAQVGAFMLREGGEQLDDDIGLALAGPHHPQSWCDDRPITRDRVPRWTAANLVPVAKHPRRVGISRHSSFMLHRISSLSKAAIGAA